MDQKSKKLNVVSTERFNEISEQVKRSIELAAQLSNSFKFMEPIPVDSQLSNSSDHFGISKFEFCGPFEQQSDEKNDTITELVARLSGLNLFCDQLDCSAQLDISSNLGVKYSNDNFHDDASHRIKLECPLQQYVENNSVAKDGKDNSEINVGESKDKSQSEQWSNQLNCSGQMNVTMNPNDGNNNCGTHVEDLKGTSQRNQLSSNLNCSAQKDFVTSEISNDDKDTGDQSSIHKDHPLEEDVTMNVVSNDGNDNFDQSSNQLNYSVQEYDQSNDGNDHCENHEGESKGPRQSCQSSSQLNGSAQEDIPRDGNDHSENHVGESKGTSQSNKSSNQLNCSVQGDVPSNDITRDGNDHETHVEVSKSTSQNDEWSSHSISSIQNDVVTNDISKDGNDRCETHVGESKGQSQTSQSSSQLNWSVQEDVQSNDITMDGNDHSETHEVDSKGRSQGIQSSNQLNCSAQGDVATNTISKDGKDNCETHVEESKCTSQNGQWSGQSNSSVQRDVVTNEILKDDNDAYGTQVGESKGPSQSNQSSSQLNCSAQSSVPTNDIYNNSSDNCKTHVVESKGASQSSQSANQLNSSVQEDVTMHEISNDNFQMDSHLSHQCRNRLDCSCSLQQDIDNNPLSKGELDSMQTDVGRSTGIDPNTQITHVDIDSNEQNRPPPKQYGNQPLPLLIKHIQRITWPRQDEVYFVPEMELFGQTFNAVMVYGIVTSLTVEDNGLTQRFVIDDGSGSVNVTWKANKQLIGQFKTLQVTQTPSLIKV